MVEGGEALDEACILRPIHWTRVESHSQQQQQKQHANCKNWSHGLSDKSEERWRGGDYSSWDDEAIRSLLTLPRDAFYSHQLRRTRNT